MDKNLNNIAEELFGKLRTQFPKVQMGDEESNVTDEEKTARVFKFEYTSDKAILGNVNVSISDDDGLVVIYSNDIVEGQDEYVKNKFFNFLQELREFAKQRFMNFDTRDISKSNLEKRDYEYMANKHGEGTMSESKLFGTSRTSYQQLGDAKLIVKHSAPINFENPAGRAQRIESIYIENAQGERFKYPFKHLNGARALATHVAHGGNPYDSIGGYVIGLSEELNNLRMFKSYVDRNPVVSEAMGSIQSKVLERIDSVKKEIHNLQNSARYSAFAESFEESQSAVIPEDIMNDWIDRLTIRTFNEELKNVFPYIFKLIDESDIPVKDLTIEDLVTEEECKVCGMDPCDCDHAETKEVKEFADYERQLSKILGERTDIFSDQEESKQAAIDKLNQLITQPMPVGTDGNNATESLTDVIDDDELMDVFRELADVNPEQDIRSLIKDYIEIKDKENGTDVLSAIQFPNDLDAEAPEVPAEAPPVDPAAAAPTPPVAEGMSNDVEEFLHKVARSGDNGYDMLYNAQKGKYGREIEQAVQDMYDDISIDTGYHGDDDFEQIYDRMMDNIQNDYGQQDVAETKEDPPFDGPYKKPGDNKDKFGNTVKNPARHAAKKGMADAIAKAKKAGATSETIIRIAGEEMTLGEAITKAGMKVEDIFGNKKEAAANELIEFVKSMFNKEEGTFPKGETGVLIACEKKFGEGSVPVAQQIIEKLQGAVESQRIRELAGIIQQR